MLVRNVGAFLLLLDLNNRWGIAFPQYDTFPAVVLIFLSYEHDGHLILQVYNNVIAIK